MGNHNHHNDCNHKGEHHQNDHHHSHKITSKKKLVIVILFNVIITISEFVGGILSGSLALVSDAWHNLSDVLSLMLGYAGEKVSETDRSKNYTFGLKRFEVLIALINALSLLAIGIFIVYEAVMRFKNPVPINISIMIPVAVIGLLGNVFSILVLSKNKDENLNLKAAFLHLMYDAISSVAVIAAGIVLYYTNFFWIDLVISLMIVIMIVWSSVDIIKESFRIFLQGAPSDIDTDAVYKSLMQIKGVGSIHGLHIWSISSTEVFLSCHICIDEKYSKEINDNIILDANAMLSEKYSIEHTTIQVETSDICSDDPDKCCR